MEEDGFMDTEFEFTISEKSVSESLGTATELAKTGMQARQAKREHDLNQQLIEHRAQQQRTQSRLRVAELISKGLQLFGL